MKLLWRALIIPDAGSIIFFQLAATSYAVRAEPRNYSALVKAAHDAVDLGEFDPSAERRDTLYRNAETHARGAIALDSKDAMRHSNLGTALQDLGRRDEAIASTRL